MMERNEVHGQPEFQPLRGLRDGRQQHHRRGQQRKAVHEMHLGQPQAVKPQLIGLARFFDQFGVTLARTLTSNGGQLVEKIKFH